MALAGILILIGVLALVNGFVEVSPWGFAGCWAGTGLGNLSLYLVDRSDAVLLLLAYSLWVVAGLLSLIPAGFLRDEAIAVLVPLEIAPPLSMGADPAPCTDGHRVRVRPGRIEAR